jgi:hypothetical protein
MHAPYRGHRIMPSGALLDGVGSFSTSVAGAYSFRKVRSAYTGNAMKLRRASDSAELDIGFLGFVGFTGAPWDVAAATAHCAATTCWLRTWYDQSGLGRDLVNPAAATQLQLNLSCSTGRPCFQNTAVSTQSAFTSLTYTPVSPVSISSVNNRAMYGASSECLWFRQNNLNRVVTFALPWYLATAGVIAATPQPADGAWHTQQGVINGAGSVINVDGVETTGSLTADVAVGGYLIGTNTAAATTCQFAEAIVWSGYALTPAERTFLTSNQRAYIGP